MDEELQGLVEEIEVSRIEMVQLASKTSLLNQQVIEASKRLDSLLNKFYSQKG